MSIQSWKWRNIDSIIPIYHIFWELQFAELPECIAVCELPGLDTVSGSAMAAPLSYDQVGSPSNPDLWRKRPNTFRTFTKDHRTWPSRMESTATDARRPVPDQCVNIIANFLRAYVANRRDRKILKSFDFPDSTRGTTDSIQKVNSKWLPEPLQTDSVLSIFAADWTLISTALWFSVDKINGI
jgi:hypothetical protein